MDTRAANVREAKVLLFGIKFGVARIYARYPPVAFGERFNQFLTWRSGRPIYLPHKPRRSVQS
jgi:hypothetical protein